MQSNDRASLSSTHGQVMFWNKSLILIHILDGRQRKWNLHFWSGNLLNVFRLRVALVVNPRFQWQFFVPFRFECQKLVLVGDPKVSSLNNLFYGRGPGDPASPPYFSPNWGPKDRKNFWDRPPPYPRVWMTPPPHPAPYRKVWIRHCTVTISLLHSRF